MNVHDKLFAANFDSGNGMRKMDDIVKDLRNCLKFLHNDQYNQDNAENPNQHLNILNEIFDKLPMPYLDLAEEIPRELFNASVSQSSRKEWKMGFEYIKSRKAHRCLCKSKSYNRKIPMEFIYGIKQQDIALFI